MNPQNTPQPSGDQNPPNLHPLVVLRPGERVICEIKRHPFGIMTMYASGVLAILITALLAVFAPEIVGDYGSTDTGDLQSLALVGVGIVTVGIVAGLFLATTVYWQNRWIVTDDSITQITQNGLFGRRVSQLSLESLEDITVDQHGIVQSMFNFGTLHAETAGEKSKFVFIYCPNPNKYARQILQAHEMFLHQTRHQPQAVHPVEPDVPGPTQDTSNPLQFTSPQPYLPPQNQIPPSPQQYGSPQVPQLPHQPGTPVQNQQSQQDQQGNSRPAIWGD